MKLMIWKNRDLVQSETPIISSTNKFRQLRMRMNLSMKIISL